MKINNVHEDAALLKKALLQQLTETEKQQLETLLQEKPRLRQLYGEWKEGEEWKTSLANYKKYSGKKAYQDFLRRIHPARTRRYILRWWQVAAAVVVLAVGVALWQTHVFSIAEWSSHNNPVITPGTYKAQLVLPDGSVIDVNKKDVEVVVNGVKVNYKKGLLSYHEEPGKQEEPTATEPDYNKLIIPRGGENTVVLCDGTTVHLNAGSRLIYPVTFIGKERRVILEGEGYFEVVRDEKHRFVVETRFGDVAVLGTAFNVHAYNDAKTCYTTLVHGKVSFCTPAHEEIILSPGEQAVVSDEGMEKRHVDIEEYVGWVNGIYVFKDKPLEDIMDTFSKWYDITVFYETPTLRRLTYSGNLKRYDSINSFLDALALTGDIRYKINGKNVLIYETIDED